MGRSSIFYAKIVSVDLEENTTEILYYGKKQPVNLYTLNGIKTKLSVGDPVACMRLSSGSEIIAIPIIKSENYIIVDKDLDIVNFEKMANFKDLLTINGENYENPGDELLFVNSGKSQLNSELEINNSSGVSTIDGEEILNKVATIEVEIPPNSVIVSVSGGSGAPAVGVANTGPITCNLEIVSSGQSNGSRKIKGVLKKK